MRGLVLTAGGARGAYQAGVLRRIGELPSLRGRPSPFAIVAGASAGAINGSIVAAGSLDFRDATKRIARLWSELEFHDVVKADALSLGWNGARLLRDLSLGGILGGAGARSLLDTTPLRSFLAPHLKLGGIAKAIDAGVLHAVAISATSYHSGKSFTFIQGQPGHRVWSKSRRVALAAQITLEHVLASAAIPIIFPPVLVRTGAGALHFGDGELRLVNPISPAIRLGANADLDHLLRMNELVQAHRRVAGEREDGLGAGGGERMRIVEPLVVNPSEDLALVASRFASQMPRLIRHLMDGLGTPDARVPT